VINPKSRVLLKI